MSNNPKPPKNGPPKRRTGVIVGVELDKATQADLNRTHKVLSEKFPGVDIAIITGANSIAFEYEVDDA